MAKNDILHYFSGRERWIVKIRDFRQRWLFWSMGLQIQDSGLLFGVQRGRSDLHGQSPKWFWTLVCPSSRAASSQFTFYRSQKIRTFVWCSGKNFSMYFSTLQFDKLFMPDFELKLCENSSSQFKFYQSHICLRFRYIRMFHNMMRVYDKLSPILLCLT